MVEYPSFQSGNGSKQPLFLTVTGVLLLLSTLVVCGRYYCRIVYLRNLGLDDIFIGLALCVTLSLGIMNGFHVSYGAGTHADNYLEDPAKAYIPTLKHWYAYQIVYPLALALVKMSFLALYNRIFPPPNINRTLLYGTAAFIAIYTIVVMFVNVFECSTPSDAWKPDFPKPSCNDLQAMYYSTAGIHIFTDLAVLILPIRPALNLNVNRRRKAAVVGIFMIGGIAIVASCVRIHALRQYFTSDDPTYDTIEVLIWSQIEVNVAVICSSIASLRPLFKSVFSGTGSRSDGGKYCAETYTGRQGTVNTKIQRYSGGREFELYTNQGSQGRASNRIEPQIRSMDNDSEELILSDRKGEGITVHKTIERRVSSENAGSEPHSPV